MARDFNGLPYISNDTKLYRRNLRLANLALALLTWLVIFIHALLSYLKDIPDRGTLAIEP